MKYPLLLASTTAPAATNDAWTLVGVVILVGLVAFTLIRLGIRARRDRVWP